jgi:hypothetical protein
MSYSKHKGNERTRRGKGYGAILGTETRSFTTVQDDDEAGDLK